ncbi:MAG: energy transducer TonB [Candidatus Accumulibacter sp.]|jgi:protein TonB|nr:energy transducer TonB [Accumulibacter sp.]
MVMLFMAQTQPIEEYPWRDLLTLDSAWVRRSPLTGIAPSLSGNVPGWKRRSGSPRPSSVGRGSLLGVVLVVHVGFLGLLASARTAPPERLEAPIMVDFIELVPLPVEEPVAQPLPMAPPVPEPPPTPVPIPPPPVPAPPPPVVEPEPVPIPPAPTPKPPRKVREKVKPPTPPLETTSSAEPAPASAPVAASPEPVAIQASVADDNDGGGSAVLTPAPISSGNGNGPLVNARFDADYLSNPAPPYPPQSRRLGEEGQVILSVLVSSEGAARQVDIRTSSGSGRLDDSAQRTVRTWKFIPAKRGGVVVESWVLIPILFKLEQ